MIHEVHLLVASVEYLIGFRNFQVNKLLLFETNGKKDDLNNKLGIICAVKSNQRPISLNGSI